jgi:hypothetical protein
VVYETANRTVEADIVAGSVFVTGQDPILWLRVNETTEALEVYPDAELLRAVAGGEPELQPAAAARDGTVLAICSVLKQAHTAGVVLSDMAASTLAHVSPDTCWRTTVAPGTGRSGRPGTSPRTPRH